MLRRPKPTSKVVASIENQPLESLFISVVRFAEIRFGIVRLDDLKRRTKRTSRLTHKVRPLFEQCVLPVSEEEMFKCRLLVDEGRKNEHTYSQPFLIIAAKAVRCGLVVVSRETTDYLRADVSLFTPARTIRSIGRPRAEITGFISLCPANLTKAL